MEEVETDPSIWISCYARGYPLSFHLTLLVLCYSLYVYTSVDSSTKNSEYQQPCNRRWRDGWHGESAKQPALPNRFHCILKPPIGCASDSPLAPYRLGSNFNHLESPLSPSLLPRQDRPSHHNPILPRTGYDVHALLLLRSVCWFTNPGPSAPRCYLWLPFEDGRAVLGYLPKHLSDSVICSCPLTLIDPASSAGPFPTPSPGSAIETLYLDPHSESQPGSILLSSITATVIASKPLPSFPRTIPHCASN